MERRREPRVKPQQPVAVTILDESGQYLDAVVQDASGRGLGLMTSRPVEPGKALKIQLDNAMLLAEAVYCQAAGSGFYVGVELAQLSQLDRLGSRTPFIFSGQIPKVCTTFSMGVGTRRGGRQYAGEAGSAG